MIKVLIEDDIKAFEKEYGLKIKKNNIHFGSYSLLSSLYIFNARKILSRYEKQLLTYYYSPKLNLGYNRVVDERFALLSRLNIINYLDKSSVHPLEVLLLQGNYKKIVKLNHYFFLDSHETLQHLIDTNVKQKWINRLKKHLEMKRQIPTKVEKSLTVVEVPANAIQLPQGFFDDCSNLKKIIFPVANNNIKEYISNFIQHVVIKSGIIPKKTFYKHVNLQNVIIEKGVTHIGASAFAGCIGLTNINIPESITEMGERAFSGCCNLKNINIESSIKQIPLETFYKCHSLKEVNIPKTIKEVGTRAFYGCQGLKELVIPDSVVNIGYEAFYGCHNLTDIKISSQLNKIGEYAFAYCKSLKYIKIPSSLSGISETVFLGCDSLVYNHLQIIKNATNLKNIKEVSNGLYNYNKPMDGNTLSPSYKEKEPMPVAVPKRITISSNETRITYSTMEGNRDATSVIIPNTVTSIEADAFRDCKNLSNIIIPNSVEKIGDMAFANCSELTQIIIPNSVTKLGEKIFIGCSHLKKVELPEICALDLGLPIDSNIPVTIKSNVKYMQINNNPYSSAFGVDNKNIMTLAIEDQCKLIEKDAFHDCQQLTDAYIPESVLQIGKGVFSGCCSMALIELPFIGQSRVVGNEKIQYPFGYIFGTEPYKGAEETQQKIGNFNMLNQTYYIPKSLKRVIVTQGDIPKGAFYNCRGLIDITIPASTKIINDYTFAYCTGLNQINIPNRVKEIGSCAFAYCSNIKKVNISHQINDIKSFAFMNCSNLSEIELHKSLRHVGSFAFVGCSSLRLVRYSGTKSDFDRVIIDEGNEALISAKIIFQ